MSTRTLLLLGSLLLLVGCHGRLTRPDLGSSALVGKAREAEIQTWPWPDYVNGEDRARIEAALKIVFDVGGREARDAEASIVALDKDADANSFRAVGRLVSEMKTVIDTYGVDNYEGKSRIMVLDRMLRQLDGVQERLFGEETGLDIDDSPARAMRLVHTWNWWYRDGRFLMRYATWDPRVDLQDEPEPGTGTVGPDG